MDIVIGDRAEPPAKQVLGVGSIKWTTAPFDEHMLAALSAAAPQVPGFDPATTVLLAVARSGFRDPVPERVRTLGPQDLIDAMRHDDT